MVHRADLFRESATSTARAADQQIVSASERPTSRSSSLYAQREIEVAEHEQETAAALLSSVDEHVKAGLAVESDRMSAQVNVAARKEELIAARRSSNWRGLLCVMGWGAPNLKPTEFKPIEPTPFRKACWKKR